MLLRTDKQKRNGIGSVFCHLIALWVEPERAAVASPTNPALSPLVGCAYLPWAADCPNRPHGVSQVFSYVLGTPRPGWEACVCIHFMWHEYMWCRSKPSHVTVCSMTENLGLDVFLCVYSYIYKASLSPLQIRVFLLVSADTLCYLLWSDVSVVRYPDKVGAVPVCGNLMQETKTSQLAVSYLTKCYLCPSARAGPLVSQKSVGQSCAAAHPSFSLSLWDLSGVSLPRGEQCVHLRNPSVRGTTFTLFCIQYFW